MLTPSQRDYFDALLDAIVAELPDHLHELLEEVPLIVEDEPSADLLREMGICRGESDLCGLHWGVPLTERSVWSSGTMPDRMMMFRGPIMRLAGYRGGRSGGLGHFRGRGRRDELENQIRITLLHEIGHHFGLDEDDLAELGYA